MARKAWTKEKETMKYTVFSIDSSRQHYVKNIHAALHGWKFVPNNNVNGREPAELSTALEEHGYGLNFPEGKRPRVGQLGIWLTVLNALGNAPLVTFEDDAMLGPQFKKNFDIRISELPDDADFFSLFLPRDSDHLCSPEHFISKHLCRTYQRYGGVSMYYTEQGARKIKKLLSRDGFTGQYDDTLYAYSKSGELNGYCSKPTLSDLVYISGLENSIVQETDFYERT